MLHFCTNLFFSVTETDKKNASEPLQALDFTSIPDGHQMLHKCNILRRILLKSELYPNFLAENVG